MNHSTHVIYAFTYVTSLNLNVCVSIDLIFMLKNPFKKSEARYHPFLYASIIFGALETIVLDLPFDTVLIDKIKSMINLGSYLGFVILGIISIFVSFKALSKPGTSLEIRKLLFQRHFLYINAYIVCNIFTALSDLVYLFHEDKHDREVYD